MSIEAVDSVRTRVGEGQHRFHGSNAPLAAAASFPACTLAFPPPFPFLRVPVFRCRRVARSVVDKSSSAMSESSFPLSRRAPPDAKMSSLLDAASNSAAAKLLPRRDRASSFAVHRIRVCCGRIEL